MTEMPTVRLKLSSILSENGMSVADLIRRIETSGYCFDKKTVYRMASEQALQTLNLPILAAIGRVLEMSDPGKLIQWSPSESGRLQRIDAGTQARLDELMAKNTEGELDAAERVEFEKLGRRVENLSLENARLLARHAQANKRFSRQERLAVAEESPAYKTARKTPRGKRRPS